MTSFIKHKENSADDEAERNDIIPSKSLTKVSDRKDGEHEERNDLLNRFQLCSRELVGTDPVGRHLEAIFSERNSPTGDDRDPEWGTPEFQMSVPGEGHEYVGNREQNDSFHRRCKALLL